MATGDYVPRKDTSFQSWLNNFVSVVSDNLSILGLTSSDINSLSSDKEELGIALAQAELLSAQSKAATIRKNTMRSLAEDKTRALVRKIQANPEVPSSLKKQLQLNVAGEASSYSSKPIPPTNLLCKVLQPGAYQLKWNANGNPPRTLYSLEAKIGSSNTFIPIVTITKSKYTYTSKNPYEKITFIVRAQRGTSFSLPSNAAVANLEMS